MEEDKKNNIKEIKHTALGQKIIDFDDKDLIIAGLTILGAVYVIGAFMLGQDPADVLQSIVSGLCGLAVGCSLSKK